MSDKPSSEELLRVPEFAGWLDAQKWACFIVAGMNEEQYRQMGRGRAGDIYIDVNGETVGYTKRVFRIKAVQMLYHAMNRHILRRVVVKAGTLDLKVVREKYAEIQAFRENDQLARGEDQKRRNANEQAIESLAKELNISRRHLRCDDGEFKLAFNAAPLLRHEVIAVVEAVRGAVPGMFDAYRERGQ